ncbi:MAG: hypothetical protein ACREPA_11500, partial [Candidatus Dormibacteraceae bacterium]
SAPPGRAGRSAPAGLSLSRPSCPPGDPLAGVYHPDRLRLLARCREARGVAVLVRDESDGDHHIWIRLDAGFTGMARDKDFYDGTPELVLEIIPRCPGRPADSEAAAACPASELPVPAAGDHVDVWGPYVMDLDHDWAEIHPVNSIAIS